jgi:hypothetical protein
MKRIPLILCTFVLCLTMARPQRFLEDALPGGYQDLDVSAADSDADVKASLDFGTGQIIKEAYAAKDIPVSVYKVSKINSISSQVVAGLNHKFDVELSNDLGTTVKTTFVVYWVPWQNTRELTDHTYNVQNEEFQANNLPGGWFQIKNSKVNNDESIKTSLTFGKKEVVKQAKADGNIPSSKYAIAKIISAYQQVVGGMNYRFTVRLDNDNGTVLKATYVVYWNPWEKTRKLSKYAYQVVKGGS